MTSVLSAWIGLFGEAFVVGFGTTELIILFIVFALFAKALIAGPGGRDGE
jgi:hypothetical protein